MGGRLVGGPKSFRLTDPPEKPLSSCRDFLEGLEITTCRWWQLKCFLFSPRNLGKISNLTNIFQMGSNHQPDKFCLGPKGLDDESEPSNTHQCLEEQNPPKHSSSHHSNPERYCPS